MLRLKGWMLTLKDDPEGAEQNYLASLDWARTAGEVMGTAHFNQPRKAVATTRQAQGSTRTPRGGL